RFRASPLVAAVPCRRSAQRVCSETSGLLLAIEGPVHYSGHRLDVETAAEEVVYFFDVTSRRGEHIVVAYVQHVDVWLGSKPPLDLRDVFLEHLSHLVIADFICRFAAAHEHLSL